MKGGGGTVRFGLRLPASMYLKLQENARERGHSINSEIVEMLSSALESSEIVSSIEKRLHEESSEIMSRLHEAQEQIREGHEQLHKNMEEFREEMRKIELPEGAVDQIKSVARAAEFEGRPMAALLTEALRRIISEREQG